MPRNADVMDPVVKSVRVELPIEAAFALFTREIDEWWPAHTHSIAADSLDGAVTATKIVFECSEGGRIYEVMSDGREGTWGTVGVWEPPTRVVFSWNPSLEDRPSTEVEVRFVADGEATVVVLEHRGWELLGAAGADFRAGYDEGWVPILDRLSDAASRAST